MKKMIFCGWLAVVLVFLGISEIMAQWQETDISKLITLPNRKIEIIPPPSDTSPKVAAFSGRWEGMVENDQPFILVVEKIVEKIGGLASADIVYCTGISKYGRGGCSDPRTTGEIENGVLKINTSSRNYILKMEEGDKIINGRIELKGGSRLPYYEVVLKKIE